MDFIKSVPFKFVLPIVLLGLQLALKFFIDRRATAYNFIVAVLEVPINMFFISLSLIAAFIISGHGDTQLAFLFFLSILVVLIFGIFCWRRSVENLDQKKFIIACILGTVNLILSLPIFLFIVYFLIG